MGKAKPAATAEVRDRAVVPQDSAAYTRFAADYKKDGYHGSTRVFTILWSCTSSAVRASNYWGILGQEVRIVFSTHSLVSTWSKTHEERSSRPSTQTPASCFQQAAVVPVQRPDLSAGNVRDGQYIHARSPASVLATWRIGICWSCCDPINILPSWTTSRQVRVSYRLLSEPRNCLQYFTAQTPLMSLILVSSCCLSYRHYETDSK